MAHSDIISCLFFSDVTGSASTYLCGLGLLLLAFIFCFWLLIEVLNNRLFLEYLLGLFLLFFLYFLFLLLFLLFLEKILLPII